MKDDIIVSRENSDGSFGEFRIRADYEIMSSAFVAMQGHAYALDTTAGSFEVTISDSLAVGAFIDFSDAFGSWEAHPPTFIRNGFKIEGEEIDFTDASLGTFFRILNVGGGTGLRILESVAKPHNIGLPSISGNNTGRAATSTNGLWTGNPTSYRYQWQISDDGATGWADIAGAVGADYSPLSAYAGKFVRIGVAATNSNGTSVTAFSAASDALVASPFPAGAIGYWRLNEATGAEDRVDATGNGWNLTATGSIVGADGVTAFDGGNFLYASGNPNAAGGVFTFNIWIKGSPTILGSLAGAWCGAGGATQWFIQNFEGTVDWYFHVGGGWPPLLIPTAADPTQWNLITVQCDGSEARAKINGGDWATDGGGLPSTLQGWLGDCLFSIGNVAQWIPDGGSIDCPVRDASMFSSVLSDADISAIVSGAVYPS